MAFDNSIRLILLKKVTNSDKYKSLVKEVTNSIEKIKAEKEKDRYNELYGDIIKNSKKYGISIDQTKFIKPKWYIQNRLNNESYKELINASDNIKKLGNIFPLIFFAISILVSLISMMRMIEEDRTENGTLKSLGYNNFEITLKYIIYSLLATIIGSISGVFIGSYLIPYVIWNIYKKLFFTPKFIYLIYMFLLFYFPQNEFSQVVAFLKRLLEIDLRILYQIFS